MLVPNAGVAFCFSHHSDVQLVSSVGLRLTSPSPPLSLSLSDAVDASRHAVRVVTESLICADGAWKGVLRSGLSCFAAGRLREAAGRGDE